MTEEKSNKNVLVIEDDHDTSNLIAEILGNAGYTPAAAYDGESGIEMAKAEQPDLIVLDLMLPNIDGLEVCRRLAGDDNTRSIPVIVLTAKKELSTKLSSFVAGARRFLTKPFEDEELINEIGRTLRQKNMQILESGEPAEPRD